MTSSPCQPISGTRRRRPRRAPRSRRARCRSARRSRIQACCREREARVARGCALAEGGLRSCSRVILDHPRPPAPVCRGVVNAGPKHPVTDTPDGDPPLLRRPASHCVHRSRAARRVPHRGSAVAGAGWHHVARRRPVGARKRRNKALWGQWSTDGWNPMYLAPVSANRTSPSSRSASDSGRRGSSRWRWGRSRFCS